MITPTIAEERLARQIAYWHGQYALAYKDGQRLSVADYADNPGHGWAYKYDQYVDRHWREYVPAAHAILEFRNEPSF